MADRISILDGQTFVVSDCNGDIDASPSTATGLFTFDTRYLSRWLLRINGEPLNSLSVDDTTYFESRFFLVPGAPTHYVDAKVSVIRERSIGGGFLEKVTIFNHDRKPVDLDVRVEVAADFRDLARIRDGNPQVGEHYARVENGRLTLGYQRGRFRREANVACSAQNQPDRRGLSIPVHLEAHAKTSFKLRVVTFALAPGGRDIRDLLGARRDRSNDQLRQELDEWVRQMPRLDCDWKPLTVTYQRSVVDLAALRFRALTNPNAAFPAGGLPWAMTITGRDSIITSFQALPFVPEMAKSTLTFLGIVQGNNLDDFRDEEPGKIQREFRYGETAAFEERPLSPYFGSADTTPLWLILLDEYERWTGDADLVRELEPEARAALHWLDEFGDLLGNGYLAYQPRGRAGLINQGWKEAPDAISYADGSLPGLPRATCELQGYAYDARMRAARMARLFWGDPTMADRLEKQAEALKERFNEDFWIGRLGYYAVALDSDGRQVDALASNIGHLLWSGIVDESRAGRIVEHLVGPRMFTGWGIRSLATSAARYNPIGYQTGAVWPWDNSFITLGMRRYGFTAEAALVTESVLEAGYTFGGRLPECFGGYERSDTKHPVEYPSACSPQAWSTGATLMFLRTLLGLKPVEEYLVTQPAVPASIDRIDLLNIPGRWGLADALGRGQADLGRRREGVPVLR
ncbi:amylo-alpha-1,6-glucosidase [Micromonospora zhanjiangensis]